MIGANGRMFDPATYNAVRRPLLEARTLPAWCYTSPEWHAREVERLFGRGWNFIGRVEQWPKAGDWESIALPNGQVLVVRGRDGRVRVFSNNCRHRGAMLLEGKGNCRAIQCPYHAWTYGLDGKLVGAPDMEKTVGFDRAEWGLTPVRSQVWKGFLFVAFDESVPPLEDYLGSLPQELGQYAFEDMVCVGTRDYQVAANWKFILENALEAYHTPTVHKQTLGGQYGDAVETEGNWNALFVRNGGKDTLSLLPGQTTTLPFIPTLTDKARDGGYFTVVYPSTQFACAQDSIWWLRFYPTGPESTHLNVGFCFPKQTVARPDFAAESKKHIHRWLSGIAEDNAISELQQKGAHAPAHTPGPVSWNEQVVYQFQNAILDRVL